MLWYALDGMKQCLCFRPILDLLYTSDELRHFHLPMPPRCHLFRLGVNGVHSVQCGAVQELVQVESLAQVGVQLLLFTLGLEFSLSKLRAVRSVALLGEPLKIYPAYSDQGILARLLLGVRAAGCPCMPHVNLSSALA